MRLMNETQGRGEALVNTEEAAKRLGVSPSTMVNWRRRKYGPPYVMVSRLVRYRVADLATFIERGVVETTATVAAAASAIGTTGRATNTIPR